MKKLILALAFVLAFALVFGSVWAYEAGSIGTLQCFAQSAVGLLIAYGASNTTTWRD